jgi:hypothetical protein
MVVLGHGVASNYGINSAPAVLVLDLPVQSRVPLTGPLSDAAAATVPRPLRGCDPVIGGRLIRGIPGDQIPALLQ